MKATINLSEISYFGVVGKRLKVYVKKLSGWGFDFRHDVNV